MMILWRRFASMFYAFSDQRFFRYLESQARIVR